MLFGLCIFHQLRGEIQQGRELAEQLLTLAQSVQNPTLLLRAHMALGNALYFLGDFAAARNHLQQGFAFYLPHKHSPLVSNIAQDLGVICVSRTALTLWFLGYPDQARLSSDKGLTLAQELSHPFSQAFALHAAAGVQQECRALQTGQRQVETLISLSEEYGFPYYAAWGGNSARLDTDCARKGRRRSYPDAPRAGYLANRRISPWTLVFCCLAG